MINEPAATEDQIANAELSLRPLLGSHQLPAELKEIWRKANGIAKGIVHFYSTDDIFERNDTYETLESCPGYLVVADDSGSRIALIKLDDPLSKVFLNYMGDMAPDSMEPTHRTLNAWVEQGCTFDYQKYPKISPVLPVVLVLRSWPAGGLAAVMKIRKILNLEVPMSEMAKFKDRLPIPLAETTYSLAKGFLKDVSEARGNVEIRGKATSEILPDAGPD